MSSKFLVLSAGLVALILGGVAGALLLDKGSFSRPSAAAYDVPTCTANSEIRTGSRDEATLPPQTGELLVDPTPPDKTRAPDIARARLLARVDASLRALIEKQTAVFELTAEPGDELSNEPDQSNEDARTLLHKVTADQAEVQKLAAQLLATFKAEKFVELASDMEQVLRLLAAIMGNLGAREPDVGSLTNRMQYGVIEKLQKMLPIIQVELDRLMLQREVSAPVTGNSQALTVGAQRFTDIRGDRSVTDLTIEAGAKLKLGSGTLTVTGDFRNDGTLDSAQAALVMSGGNQTFSGTASFQKVRFSGGTKHISAGSSLTTTYAENSDKDHPILVVEAGTTLIIDKDASVNIPNACGLRVAGTLIIDGGTFRCSFTHGSGVENMNHSWIKGCQLIVRSGSFIGDGDASFDGASVSVQGGELRINDDIWGSGDLLEISGGVISNSSGGGMFNLSGPVRINGGRLEINQYEGRGLQVAKEAEIWSLGGEVVIGGQDVSEASSGIVLAHDVQLPNLTLNVSTLISTSTPDGTTLSVSGSISIGKGKKLVAQGRRVVGLVETGEEFGEFVP